MLKMMKKKKKSDRVTLAQENKGVNKLRRKEAAGLMTG
jgi:hypothetical protein